MLQVDTESSIPIYVQLREQIKYLIYGGDLPPNAPLPSAELLSQNLQVNRNTILRAYRELRDESFVVFRPGKGTFVADHPPAPAYVNGSTANGIVPKLDDVIAEALDGGMSKAELLSLMMLRVHSHRNAHSTQVVRVALVECNADRLGYYTKELGRELEVEILPLLLTEFDENPAHASEVVQHADLVVSPFFHLTEVRRALQKLGARRNIALLAITIRPHLDVVARLAKLRKGSRVAVMFVHQDSYSERMMNSLLQVLQRVDLPIELRPVYVYPGQAGVAERLADYDVAIVQPENIHAVSDLIPSRVRIIQWANVLDEASLEMLREEVKRILSRV
ncbi:MAG TPA: GntR family transcriptional regulator [Anaerolineae bacterium]|nr:GntR family transcriptional regulator [Anaerolineae bacterium]HPL30583.1 GntR family transcriptional regulator [Anaerolineae bacterium]